ncbi:FHA domain-containing protein [Herbiconiux sp. KACC 21604]|uniref:FHA domain-containing protein n=1 Tax=unclassified Herbiconiux TaxID=2618217 RepID=UPI0014919851|nr:FHA domain-containing protein [Herbiconiux sp. SALV-R1]QJU55578.1 FHA domain-containing protein [Herbiconiux sp. SALV-R1]WPO86770.1 FHA domain-containing protein [Herbiconiux sp. KACC 21604]
MTAFHYTPGGWHAIVAPAGVAVLPAGVSGEMLERLWLSLSEGHGLGAVLESLTGAFGTSLRAIPPFAVATVDGSEVRLAVRGELAIDVVEAGAEGATDGYSVSGADVTTWSERVVPTAQRLVLRATSAPDGADGEPTDARYRIASGVVLSSSIEVDLTAPTITVPTPAAAATGAARSTADSPAGPADPVADAATGAAPLPEDTATESTDRTADAPTGAAGSTADSPAGPADPAADAATGAAHPAEATSPAVPADGSSASPATTSPATSGSESPVVAGAESPATPATESPAAPEADASAAPVVESPVAAETDFPAVSVGESQEASATAAGPSSEEIHEATLLPEDVPVERGDESTPAAPPPPTAPTDGVEQTVDDETALADDEPSAEAGAEVPAEVSIDEELGSTRSELPDDAYDHLWGATVVKSVEQAAVRELDDDETETETDSASAPTASPAAASAPPASAPAPASPAAASAPPAPASFAPPTAQAPTAPAPVTPTAGGLISGIPDFGNVGAASGSAGFDAHTVPPAAPATPATPVATAVPASTPAHPSGIDDDHDGLTVTVSELEAMRRLDAAGAGAGEAHQPATGSLGRVVLSTGETHALDRGIIIGRRPRANRVQANQVPILVTVPSPEQDISRNHLEIRLEGRHVLVVDLDTTNGSVLHRTGTPPLRLGPNEPVLVLDGDLVDLGDGVTVSFEEIP